MDNGVKKLVVRHPRRRKVCEAVGSSPDLTNWRRAMRVNKGTERAFVYAYTLVNL